MNKSKIIFVSLLLISSFLFVAFMAPKPQPQQKKWVVPAKYKNMKNPYKGQMVAKGKSLYMRNCRMCHGNKGEAGTPQARRLKYTGKLYGAAMDKQTDGELYYKSIIGRKSTGMPNYEKKIKSKKDRWAIVNFVRTLK